MSWFKRAPRRNEPHKPHVYHPPHPHKYHPATERLIKEAQALGPDKKEQKNQ